MRLITGRRQLLELLSRISLEKAEIPINTKTLQALFKDAKSAMLYDHLCDISTMRLWLAVCLQLYIARQQGPPKSIYLRILSATDVPESQLDMLGEITQCISGEIEYRYAYDLREDIPVGTYRLTLLVS